MSISRYVILSSTHFTFFKVLLEVLQLLLFSFRRVLSSAHHEIDAVMNFFLVYLAIELYVVGRLVLKDFYRLRANRIAKMEGALELGQAVALLGQKF